MTIQRMTIMFTVALSGCLLSTTASATTDSQISYSDKRPKLYPMAHTNQDDEAKRMDFGMPLGKETVLDGIASIDLVRTFDLIQITIVNTMPVIDTEFVKIVAFEPGLPDAGTFDSISNGSGALRLAPNGSGFGSNSSDFAPPAVPAPGVLSLLALAGLSLNRRRRR